ncbi:MAG: ankyrin repeat domain-containing protein, partial [Armatimonadota bacterium]
SQRNGQPEMVRLLLRQGADPNGRAVSGTSPEGSRGTGGCSGLPLSSPGLTPLHVACRMASSRYGQSMERRYGWTWTELIEMLIDAGADVNAIDGEGMAPLHCAGHDEAMVLIDHGTDIDAIDGSGNTPLHRAARRGDLDAAGLLISAGAQLNIANDDDRTPLAVAEAGRHEAVAETLRGFGAR